jgi:hypothetical protein
MVNKWKHICDLVLQAWHFPCFKDHISCKGKGALMNGDFKTILNYSCGHRDPMNSIAVVYSKMSKVRLPSQFGQGMHILMEKFLGNWPIINPSHMKADMNEANANYNPFPTIYVEDNLASLFYEHGLQGNPIVYQICLRNSNDMSCCFMFHNLTTPKHNTKVATPISPIHATCTTIPEHENPTIIVL